MKPPFYGWIIVAVSGLVLLVVFGIRLSFSVFFVALIDEFGWSRAGTALIFSVTMLVFTVGSPLSGLALDRFGPRRLFGAGAALMAAGLFLSGRTTSFPQLVLAYGLLTGLGITILGLSQQAAVIARWFRRQRGLAIGIAFAGTGMGSLLLIPAVSWLIGRAGWREAYLALALLMALLIVPIAALMRRDPAAMGLVPDGEPLLFPPPAGEAHRTGAPRAWGLSDVLTSPRFWLLFAAGLGSVGPIRLLTVHQLAIMRGAGVSLERGAAVVGAAGAVTAVAFVLSGALSDRIGRRATYALGTLGCLLAYGTLGLLSGPEQWWLLWLYPLLLGVGEGSRSSLVAAVASDLFPGRALGAVNGLIGGSFGGGAAVFPWLAGLLFDHSGSYAAAFWLAGSAAALSAAALWLAGRPRREAAAPFPPDQSISA